MRPLHPWWSRAVGYQLYVRSFADGNADGLGDLIGARQRLEHLAWLGVDAAWLTPFYPSPGADAGYDISDYRDVDPAMGTLADFDRLVERAHALGLRVVIDIVANHTSSQHPWFQHASSGTDSEYRDYYVWRDPGPDGGPPNNWVANFGGPAWTLDRKSGQYYLHLFMPEQPDLNWRSPAVEREFHEILRFWRDRDVDGFRIDVAHMLRKDPRLRDNPPARRALREPGTVAAWNAFEHVHDLDQPDVLEIYEGWRAIIGDALLLGEVYLLDPVRVARYVAGETGLDLAFWFGPFVAPWAPSDIRRTLSDAQALAPGRVAWAAGNHDASRPATRLGGGDAGRRRSLALITLMAMLPGMAFVFQGDELGLEDARLDPRRAQDPIALHGGEPDAGRDGARTPMPWSDEPGLGFTTAKEPWLPEGRRSARDTVAWQRARPGSWLHRHRALLAARRELLTSTTDNVEWLDDDSALVGYRRGDVLVAANLGASPRRLALPAGEWSIAFSTMAAADAATPLGVDEARILHRSARR